MICSNLFTFEIGCSLPIFIISYFDNSRKSNRDFTCCVIWRRTKFSSSYFPNWSPFGQLRSFLMKRKRKRFKYSRGTKKKSSLWWAPMRTSLDPLQRSQVEVVFYKSTNRVALIGLFQSWQPKIKSIPDYLACWIWMGVLIWSKSFVHAKRSEKIPIGRTSLITEKSVWVC